jgi:chaperonin cofactor prefoldin
MKHKEALQNIYKLFEDLELKLDEILSRISDLESNVSRLDNNVAEMYELLEKSEFIKIIV